MMALMSKDPWGTLSRGKESWAGRRADVAHSLGVYWAIHPNGSPGLVVRDVPSTALPKRLPALRGIALCADLEDNAELTLRLFLQEPEDRDVFHKLCTDVIEFSAGIPDKKLSAERIFLRLRRWQALVGLARGKEMSEQEVRGLLAELYVLRQVLQPKIGLESALRSWVAPDQHPQDFALSGGILEIKSRLSGSKPVVRISSLEQLETIHLPLHLLVVELAPDEAGGTLSLNEVAASLVADAHEIDVPVGDLAIGLLSKRGYAALSAYDELCYRVVGAQAFAVRHDFPRLLRGSVDARILDADYALTVTGLGSFEVRLEAAVALACGV